MDTQSLALIMSQQPADLAKSALPNAPVVAEATRPERAPATKHARRAAAVALHNLANAVAP
jgi:hypothetical protein